MVLTSKILILSICRRIITSDWEIDIVEIIFDWVVRVTEARSLFILGLERFDIFGRKVSDWLIRTSGYFASNL